MPSSSVRSSKAVETQVFTDFGNRQPGSVTGFLIQGNTLGIAQLAPYSKLKLAVSDLSLAGSSFSLSQSCRVSTPQKRADRQHHWSA
jgi:hypothetical protein